MDIEFARQARKAKCLNCVWYEGTITVSGPQPYGACHVNPPRTSSHQQWPIVMSTKWCGAFLPVANLEVVS